MERSSGIPPAGGTGYSGQANNSQEAEGRQPENSSAPESSEQRDRRREDQNAAARNRPGEGTGRQRVAFNAPPQTESETPPERHRHHSRQHSHGHHSRSSGRETPKPKQSSGFSLSGFFSLKGSSELPRSKTPGPSKTSRSSASSSRDHRVHSSKIAGDSIPRPSGPTPERQSRRQPPIIPEDAVPAAEASMEFQLPDRSARLASEAAGISRRTTASAPPRSVQSSSSSFAPPPGRPKAQADESSRKHSRDDTKPPRKGKEKEAPLKPAIRKTDSSTPRPADPNEDEQDGGARVASSQGKRHVHIHRSKVTDTFRQRYYTSKTTNPEMYGANKWSKERRRAHQLREIPSSTEASSAGGRAGRNRTYINTQLNQNALPASERLERFLNSGEDFPIERRNGRNFLDLSEREIMEEVTEWNREEYRSNQEFADNLSTGTRNLFATFSTIFDGPTREFYLTMRPRDFQPIAIRMRDNLRIINDSDFARSFPNLLTTRRSLLVEMEDGNALRATLQRWYANANAFQRNATVTLAWLADDYGIDFVTDILDLEDTENLPSIYPAWFPPPEDEPPSGFQTARSRRRSDGARESRQGTSSAGNYDRNQGFADNGSMELQQLFGRYASVLGNEVRNYYLNLPPDQFQQEASGMEQNLSIINRSAVHNRDPRLISSFYGWLVVMPHEALVARLELWNRNYSDTLSIIMLDSSYTQEEIADLLDTQDNEGGARLR